MRRVCERGKKNMMYRFEWKWRFIWSTSSACSEYMYYSLLMNVCFWHFEFSFCSNFTCNLQRFSEHYIRFFFVFFKNHLKKCTHTLIHRDCRKKSSVPDSHPYKCKIIINKSKITANFIYIKHTAFTQQFSVHLDRHWAVHFIWGNLYINIYICICISFTADSPHSDDTFCILLTFTLDILNGGL